MEPAHADVRSNTSCIFLSSSVALTMGSLSTHFPAPQLTEHRLSNSCCQIQDEFPSVTLPVMYSLIFIIGLLSNALVLWMFSCGAQRRTSITMYMRNLVLSDLLLSLCLPFCIAFQSKSEPLIFCNITEVFFYLNMYVSITFLSLISLNRYLKIIRPLQKFRIHTVSCSTMASGVVWLVHIALMLPFLFETKGKGPCDHKCFHFRSKSTTAAAFNLVAVATFFMLLLLFLYFYSKIFAKLHRVSSVKAQQLNKRTSKRVIAKTFVVLIIFMVCFTPITLSAFLTSSCKWGPFLVCPGSRVSTSLMSLCSASQPSTAALTQSSSSSCPAASGGLCSAPSRAG